jgi:putative toxin-antitoxin system antitoxin component (TIGR02293 family)
MENPTDEMSAPEELKVWVAENLPALQIPHEHYGGICDAVTWNPETAAIAQIAKYALPVWQTMVAIMAGMRYASVMAFFAKAKAKATSSARRPVTSRHARFGSRGASLGIRSAGTPQLIEQLEAGFPFDALRKFEANSGVASAVLVSILGIPERTLARRKTAGRLAPEESERLLRISSVFEKAVELFEDDVASAVQWLTTPKKALGGEEPLRYAKTEPGAREVENLIGRLEYGVFS